MPPRKRNATVKDAEAEPVLPAPKRTRRAAAKKQPEPVEADEAKAEEASEPPRKEASEPPKKDASKAVHELIKRLYPKSRKKDLYTQQLRLSISNTEGDLLLGADGKTHVLQIQEDSGAVIVVTEKVEGSVDREVLITGGSSAIARACAYIVHYLANLLEPSTIETPYHLVALIPGYKLEGLKLNMPAAYVDISSEFVPFSSFKSVYIDGKLPVVMSIIISLLEHIETVPQQLEIIPQRIPVIGIYNNPVVRSERNQKLLNQSKELFGKFLNKDYAQLKSQDADPRALSQARIEDAMKECQGKIKVLEPLKQVIDVPLDFVSAVIGRGGSKINEIRAKSNSNVVVGDSIKEDKFRTVTLTGLPEGNLTALRYLQALIQ